MTGVWSGMTEFVVVDDGEWASGTVDVIGAR